MFERIPNILGVSVRLGFKILLWCVRRMLFYILFRVSRAGLEVQV